MFNLIKVFEGSFGGSTLYENPKYVTPNAVSGMLVLGVIICSMQLHVHLKCSNIKIKKYCKHRNISELLNLANLPNDII